VDNVTFVKKRLLFIFPVFPVISTPFDKLKIYLSFLEKIETYVPWIGREREV